MEAAIQKRLSAYKVAIRIKHLIPGLTEVEIAENLLRAEKRRKEE